MKFNNSLTKKTYIIILSILTIGYSSAYAQSIEESNILLELQSIKEELENKTEQLIQTFFTIIAIPVSVLGGIYLYKHSEDNQRKESKRRSGAAIKKELIEIRLGLVGNKHTRQEGKTSREYVFGKENRQKKITYINYVNAYFVIDAYESTLHSGLFTHFKPETQHKITELYSRIRAHNETAIYIKKYADNYFLNDNVDEDDWKNAVERYQVILTLWEIEIIGLIDNVYNIDEIKEIDV